MNKGTFSAQVNEAEALLKDLELLNERNSYPRYSEISAASFRNLTYSETWKKCYDERIFDFRLADDSLVQFRGASFAPRLSVSYAYYECPYKPKVSYEKFRQQEMLSRGADIDEFDLLREHELIPIEFKDAVTPLRYDYSPTFYRPSGHPASHIHFGTQKQYPSGNTESTPAAIFHAFRDQTMLSRQMDGFDQMGER